MIKNTVQSNLTWPGGCRGAVSLTFDDGDPSQLQLAIPLLEERGLRGTFYLCPGGDAYAETLAPWRDVHARGHEIGNHSLSHICAGSHQSSMKGRYLERMSLEDIKEDVLAAEERLQNLLGEREKRSFCYPCYHTYVGAGLTRKSYVPVIAKHFIAARASGEYGLFNHPLISDLHCLTSQPCERMPGTEMIGLVERATRWGHWLILTLHSIDGGRLGTSAYDFMELVDHLVEYRDRIWTAPVRDVARHLVALRERVRSFDTAPCS